LWIEGELLPVEGEVLGWVAEDIGQCHVVLEERIQRMG
jgi:hypothetical protein